MLRRASLVATLAAAALLLGGTENRRPLSDVAVAERPIARDSASVKSSTGTANGVTPIQAAGITATLETAPCEYGYVYSSAASQREHRAQTSTSGLEPPADIRVTVKRDRGVLRTGFYSSGAMWDGYYQMVSRLGISVVNDNDWTRPVARVLVNSSYELTVENTSPGSGVIVAFRGWESAVITIRVTVMTADSEILGTYEIALDPPHAVPEPEG